MRLALLCVVVVGTAIGASLPVARPAAVAPAVVAPEPKREDPPVDTVLERSPAGHFYATVDVNGEPVRFLVDTGASTVAMTTEDAERAKVPFDPGRFEVVGRGASGTVRGQEVMLDRLTMDGKDATGLRGVVIEGGSVSLLGQSYLRNLSVEIKGDTMTLR